MFSLINFLYLKLTWKPSEERHASPPAWAMLDAPLKQVHTMRLKSFMTGNPLENKSSSGTTVQPRRTPVNPANLENDEISIATWGNSQSYINWYAMLHEANSQTIILFEKYLPLSIESISMYLKEHERMNLKFTFPSRYFKFII